MLPFSSEALIVGTFFCALCCFRILMIIRVRKKTFSRSINIYHWDV